MPRRAFAAFVRCLIVASLATLGAWAAPARAQAAPASSVAVTPVPVPPASLRLNGRRIVEFRAPLFGDLPDERAAAARAALAEATAGRLPGRVSRSLVDGVMRFEIDGRPMFYLSPDDVPGVRSADLLEAASLKAERRLMLALDEAAEANDPHRLALGAAWALGATVVAALGIAAVIGMHRLVRRALHRQVSAWHARQASGGLLATWVPVLRASTRLAASALAWIAGLLCVDLWLAFVLRQFAWTRPWGERSSAWLLDLAETFAVAALGALPGLLTAACIFALARVASGALRLLLQRVERGEVRTDWLDRDTALPTRRLGNVLIWLFALALAYPYLPGASSESFKGVTVLAGLMLSLGATGMVGQAMSGVSLMYSRTLRVGEFVRVGDVEGTVTAIGMFATALRTGTGELANLPNAWIVGQPVRNFSRTAPDGAELVQVTVTIGYATPWRQVQSMLLEAADGTEGLLDTPAPYVLQTALSDFYVEYRLCACRRSDEPGGRAGLLDRLHARIQDTFNAQGVQIMSPHYRADPAEPQVVPHGRWFPAGDDPRGVRDGRRA